LTYSYGPLLCFMALVVRMLACGASIGDALTATAAAALHGYQLYLQSREAKKPDSSQLLREEFEQLKSAVSALKLVKTYSNGGR
jgi:hypothetical protein